MRIIAGKYRGLKLAEFKGSDIRPTADRVKESLFNIINPRIVGASVLDLFCGSGNLGIESLSRGAGSVHFNDISKESIAVLRKNLAKITATNYRVTVTDYSLCLTDAAYDIIFIDPPYAGKAGIDALKMIGEGNNLVKDGIAVFERDEAFKGDIRGLEMYDERKYGRTYLSFFKNN